MAEVQPTHENAYVGELADAEHELQLAQGRVNRAKQALADVTGKPVDVVKKPQSKPKAPVAKAKVAQTAPSVTTGTNVSPAAPEVSNTPPVQEDKK